MAKHIAFGEPVNQAEAWAFNLLKQHLPDDYILLTNVEIPTQSGQAMEVDALVVGKWGIYVVDVKGYIGQLDAGQHAWTLDGREVENSLAKANYVARVLAGNIKRKIPVGVYAPWCQGMVFVTGREGNTIELNKHSEKLSVFTPQKIVKALTEEWGLTSQHRFPINRNQRELVLRTIGQVATVEKRNQRIQDFVKTKCLHIFEGMEIWQAEYEVEGWKSNWILKILVATDCDSESVFHNQAEELYEQWRRMQTLAGSSGVPHCAPLIRTGEQIVLPIRMPAGVPSQIYDLDNLEKMDILRILRRAATSLQQIHGKGFSVSSWKANQVFISGSGEVEFIDISNTRSPRHDIQGFAQCFQRFSAALHEPMLRLWFARAEQGEVVTLDELRAELSSLLSARDIGEQEASQDSQQNVINHRYQLQEKIRQGDDSEIWRAQHIHGDYPCCLTLYQNIEQRWLGLSDNYRRLKDFFHPNVERIIEIGLRNDTDDIFVSREWVAGESLWELRGSLDPEQAGVWFDQLWRALDYLHRFDLFHGGISLRNVICKGERSTLVNFGLGLDAVGNSEYRAFVAPEIWALEGEAKRDRFALAATFILALCPGAFPTQLSLQTLRTSLQALPAEFLTDTRKALIESQLVFEEAAF